MLELFELWNVVKLCLGRIREKGFDECGDGMLNGSVVVGGE